MTDGRERLLMTGVLLDRDRKGGRERKKSAYSLKGSSRYDTLLD